MHLATNPMAGFEAPTLARLASTHAARLGEHGQPASLGDDIAHQVVLSLAASHLPEGYVQDFVRTSLADYAADEAARELLSLGVGEVLRSVVDQAGSDAAARRVFGDDAQDGLQFASLRDLADRTDIDLYCRTNPTFRQRYERDLAFQHGVQAGVWVNQRAGPARRPNASQESLR